jgi:hypothetical protein
MLQLWRKGHPSNTNAAIMAKMASFKDACFNFNENVEV